MVHGQEHSASTNEMEEEGVNEGSAVRWLRQLAATKDAIEALPYVKGAVGFIYCDESANLNKVHVAVWCCWEKSRRSFKHVYVACDDAEKPTHFEALKALHDKLVREHGDNRHVPDERAVARRSEIERMGTSTTTLQHSTSFDKMRLAQARLTRLDAKVKADEHALKVARDHKVTALRALEEAEATLKQSRAMLAIAASPAKGSAASNVVVQYDKMSNGLVDQEHDDGHEEKWRSWTADRWIKHETEIQKRRAVPIDDNNHDTTLPPKGDDRRGWRHHWRRGLYDSIKDWAEGSKYRVAFMLSELTKHFKVETEVRPPRHARFAVIRYRFSRVMNNPVHIHTMNDDDVVLAGCRPTGLQPLTQRTEEGGCGQMHC